MIELGKIEELLENYRDNKERLAFVVFSIENLSGVSYDDVIEALAFAKSDRDRVQENKISDRTATIAMIYKKISGSERLQALEALCCEKVALQSNLASIDYCLEQLESRQREILHDLYVNGMSRYAVCQKYVISRKGLHSLSNKAFEHMQWMFRKSLLMEKSVSAQSAGMQ